MKPIVRNIIITVAVIGALVGAFLIVFLPTTTQIDISGDFLLSGVMTGNATDFTAEDERKANFTIDCAVTRNLIGNANRVKGIVKIGEEEYKLVGVAFGDNNNFLVYTAERVSKSNSFPIVEINIIPDINKARVYVHAGEYKGVWDGPFKEDEEPIPLNEYIYKY
ncbi:MAG: hypothetical protein E7490_06730 [Ruminococcaceae bacterium]|nr:hypothetical protein [Oscillospiraceae bacterium]